MVILQAIRTNRKCKCIFPIFTTYNNKLTKFIKHFDITKVLRYILQEKLQRLSASVFVKRERKWILRKWLCLNNDKEFTIVSSSHIENDYDAVLNRSLKIFFFIIQTYFIIFELTGYIAQFYFKIQITVSLFEFEECKMQWVNLLSLSNAIVRRISIIEQSFHLSTQRCINERMYIEWIQRKTINLLFNLLTK